MELRLTRYALERLLYRLSLSSHRERFVVKGTMLLVTWFDEPHRATRDVEVLGFGRRGRRYAARDVPRNHGDRG